MDKLYSLMELIILNTKDNETKWSASVYKEM